jgi:hypothetical protein
MLASANIMNQFWKCKVKNVLYFLHPQLSDPPLDHRERKGLLRRKNTKVAIIWGRRRRWKG